MHAIKIIDRETVKRESMIESLKREVSILMLVDHPNIVKLKEVMTTKTKIYLVLEFVSGGELFDLIKENKKLSEEQSRKYFVQLIRALGHCKSHTIAHRDIKPENMLIDSEGNLKVSDFGLSSLFKDPINLNLIMQTPCGTLNYLAPEVVQNPGYDGHIADIWSAGILLYVCVCGRLPFADENVGNLLEKILVADPFYPSYISPSLKSLLSRLIEPNFRKRATLEEIWAHPWLEGEKEGGEREERAGIEEREEGGGLQTEEMSALGLVVLLGGGKARGIGENREGGDYEEFTTKETLQGIDTALRNMENASLSIQKQEYILPLSYVLSWKTTPTMTISIYNIQEYRLVVVRPYNNSSGMFSQLPQLPQQTTQKKPFSASQAKKSSTISHLSGGRTSKVYRELYALLKVGLFDGLLIRDSNSPLG